MPERPWSTSGTVTFSCGLQPLEIQLGLSMVKTVRVADGNIQAVYAGRGNEFRRFIRIGKNSFRFCSVSISGVMEGV